MCYILHTFFKFAVYIFIYNCNNTGGKKLRDPGFQFESVQIFS